MKILKIFSLLALIASAYAESVFFDSFTHIKLTKEDVKGHIKKNTTFWCVNEMLPCDPMEGRRVDGSCNNLKYPTRGMAHTPMLRLLPADYDQGSEPRKSKSGDPLPLARKIRTTVLAEGRVPDTSVNYLFIHFWVFLSTDILSAHDTVNYVHTTPYCCEKKGKEDKVCIPIEVPEDDPVQKCLNPRCMNLTRPESFQSRGCLKNDTSFERITTATPFFDLSHVYGNNMQALNAKGRLFENGLLKFEIGKGKIFPPSFKQSKHLCLLNQPPHETRCHDIPEFSCNTILGVNLYLVWLWRLHNRIATELGIINPRWDDDRLFFEARDILIAIVSQIHYYEFLPVLLGYDNLVRDGLLIPHKGFRDIYDDSVMPQLYLEFPFVLRWAHTAQEGILRMYDSKGNYLKRMKVVNMTLRSGYLDDNLEYITHGALRQRGGKFDYVVDPDMAETILGPLQLAADVFSSDLTKNRYFGFPPYVKYREYCSGQLYRTFDDLLEVIDAERVELLKEMFEDVEDIDLIVNTWLERHIPGGRAPPTLYCIMVKQMLRSIMSDRHWYERPNRPHAFTSEQLLEIRKATMAYVMCEVGDNVKRIQPQAFLIPGPGNEICSCKDIEKVNLWAWKDESL